VRPGGRDLEGALGVRLTAHVAEIAGRRGRAREQRRRIHRGGRSRHLATQVRHRAGERVDADHRRSAGQGSFAGVRGGHEQPSEPCAPGGRRDRQDTTHGVDPPIEAELAEHAPRGEVG
jgi:hypothetical protein